MYWLAHKYLVIITSATNAGLIIIMHSLARVFLASKQKYGFSEYFGLDQDLDLQPLTHSGYVKVAFMHVL